MKTITLTLIFLLTIFGTNVSAQKAQSVEKFGKTLNLGLGVGYYGYAEHSMPVFHANFEIDVVKNFTLAPFISFYSYRNKYYKGNPRDGYSYYYHETVIPVGVKGTYYFDDLLKANIKWDFYAAASLGFAVANSRWTGEYDGKKDKYHGANPLFVAIHIGSEYHFSDRVGLFLDLSSGVSTVGLAIHFTN